MRKCAKMTNNQTDDYLRKRAVAPTGARAGAKSIFDQTEEEDTKSVANMHRERQCRLSIWLTTELTQGLILHRICYANASSNRML